MREVSISKTKLIIPAQRDQRVTRSRLIDQIDHAFSAGRQLVIVSASAGYGKTSLLSDWAHRTHLPTAWLSLESRDNDPARFISYLMAALQTLGINAGSKIQSALELQRQPSARELLQALTYELMEENPECVLVLDDIHAIKNSELIEGLHELLHDLPPKMRLILSGRNTSRLHDVHLKVHLNPLIIEEKDLRFNEQEILTFFQDCFHTPLSRDELRLIDERTEGWVTALQMIGIRLEGQQDRGAFFQSLAAAGQDIQQYLIEEVFSTLSPRVKSFLARSSLLESFSVPLLNHVLDTSSAHQMLDEIIGIKLFVVPLDEKGIWFRYHHLFRELVARRYSELQADGEPEALHLRAAEWFRRQGMWAESIDHAIKGRNFRQAAELLEQIMESYWQVGQTLQILEWIEALPEEVFHRSPNLRLFHAWMQSHEGRIEEALRTLAEVEQCVDRDECAPRLTEEQRRRIRAMLSAQKAAYQCIFGSPLKAIALADHALELLPPGANLWRGPCWNAKGMAYRAIGDWNAAIHALKEALNAHEEIRNYYGLMVSLSALVKLYDQMGRLADAYAACKRALNDIREADQRFIPTGVIFLEMGKVLREWGEFDEAESYLIDSIDAFMQEMDLQFLLEAYYQLALLRQVSKGSTEGMDVLLQAASLISTRNPPLLLAVRFRAYQIHILTLAGDVQRAAMLMNMMDLDEANQEQFLAAKQELFSNRTTAYVVASNPWQYSMNFEAISKAHLLLSMGHPQEALILLDGIEKSFDPILYGSEQLECTLLQAMAYDALGEQDTSIQVLKKAIDRSRPYRFVVSYVQFGQPMEYLLAQLLERETGLNRSSDCDEAAIDRVIYLRQLLAAFKLISARSEDPMPRSASAALAIPLTPREEEVLQLLAGGFSYKEIADQLTVSENTIRTHIRGLYRKLDANNRVLAISKAHKLGLIEQIWPDEPTPIGVGHD